MTVQELCAATRRDSGAFLSATTEQKNRILSAIKELLLDNSEELLSANEKDMKKAAENGRNAAFLDRLKLTDKRIKDMAGGLDAVIALKDPAGEVTEEYTLKNGLKVKKVRSPLGVVGIIFEARPNVSLDAAALCIKSGNGVILRGSRDSQNSVSYIVSLIKRALEANGAGKDLVNLIEGEDRELTVEMLKQDKYIDVVIPRGGEELKKVVLKNATMPVIASAGGNCHVYVAPSADEKKAIEVTLNAKLNRPSTCNAAETLLIDRKKSAGFIKTILSALKESGVELRGTAEVNGFYPVNVVGDEEFYREYDNLIMKVKMVGGIGEAIEHINRYGTNHSDAIITEDKAEAERFGKEVDSAAVYINASTRFTDGFELGLGAEMGISTQKLHVRGPVGLRELTSVKYVVTGDGHTRG